MLFTDPLFLFYFLPASLVLHRLALGRQISKVYPSAARLCIFLLTVVFYGFSSPWWLLPFLFCVVMDSIWGQWLGTCSRPHVRRMILLASVVRNLAMLGLFKYSNFFFENVAAIWPSFNATFPALHGAIGSISLPAGISFYTFESLSYVIDIYRRDCSPAKRRLEFFAFIAMFPRFIAGPIVRYRQVAAQMENYSGMKVAEGLTQFTRGLFLKTCFADSFAEFVPYAFGQVSPINFVGAWVGVLAYMMQVYFDFSGYSLMAIGLGKCLGFEFPRNFNCPFLATSMSELWRRWHMTLSAWLRDYVYIPLGGDRKGRIRTVINILITMGLGGLWHGAGWNFVLWGTWHGVWLCVEKATPSRFAPPRPVRHLLTVGCFALGLAFFNAASIPDAIRIVGALFTPQNFAWFNPGALNAKPVSLLFCALGVTYCFFLEEYVEHRMEKIDNFFLHELVPIGQFVASLLMTYSSRTIPFLYFKF